MFTIFKLELRRIRAPLLKPTAIPEPGTPRNGPISVTFENIAEVNGVAAVPDASLSDSKPSEVEAPTGADGLSAIFGSRTPKQNCTLPLKPLSVSKSSSKLRYATKCLQSCARPESEGSVGLVSFDGVWSRGCDQPGRRRVDDYGRQR